MPAIIQILQYLRGFAVFSGLGIRELRAIASIAEWTAYPAGAVLVKRGQPFAGLYLIIKGRVAMGPAADHPSGTIEPGSFFGDLELFASQPAGRDYAARDEVEALMIRTGHFLEIMKLYPLIGVNFCRYFAGKLQREGQPPPDTDRP